LGKYVNGKKGTRDMIEIEFIGTGGQGSVVAAKLLADAAVKAGYNSQSFASYGAQRRGGDVESYIRLDEGPILAHSKIYGADYVIMMDEGMIEGAQGKGKIKPGSTVIINTTKSSEDFPSIKDSKVITMNANRIALENGVTLPNGMPIINTTMLGALWSLLPSTDIDQLIESFKEGNIPAVDRNIEATRKAYVGVQDSGGVAVKEEIGVVETKLVVSERVPEYSPKLAPCEVDCPAGESIKNTTHYIKYGQFEAALESIKEENPFPGICGRVCFHPCEANCNRIQYDEGIATNALERAAFDYADSSKVIKPEKKSLTGKKVAVVGSGPAGMTCAYYLALLGHGVTVFEAQPVAGGVPRFGIPEYRLPGDVVEREVGEIADLGVDIKLNTRVGKDISFDAITGEYDACLIAAGAHLSMSLGVPGEDSSGVISGLDLLKRVSLGEKVEVGGRVAVVGGGNTAVDSARTAKRLGAGEVTIVYRRSAEEMPAFEDEVKAAEKEGIKINYLAIPVKIHSEGNKVSKFECVKAELGEKDESGRRRPVPVEGSNFTIDVDTVVTALGETLELPFVDDTLKMAGGVIEVDTLGRTSVAGVYAGGDVASQSRSVVEAIASGKRAAVGIDLYLSGGDEKTVTPFQKDEKGALSMGRYLSGDTVSEGKEVVSYEDLNVAHFTEAPRSVMAELPVETRVKNFDETDLGFTREEAIAEAERCFHCGTCTLCEVCYITCPDMVVFLESDGPSFDENAEYCKSCGICIYECPRHAISWKGVD